LTDKNGNQHTFVTEPKICGEQKNSNYNFEGSDIMEISNNYDILMEYVPVVNLRLENSVIFNPGEICCVRVKPEKKAIFQNYLFSLNNELINNHGLIAFNSIHRECPDTITLQNVSGVVQKLYQDCCVGNIRSVMNEEVVDLYNNNAVVGQECVCKVSEEMNVQCEQKTRSADVMDINYELNSKDRECIKELVNEYIDIFAWEMSDLGKTDLVEMEIDTGSS
jgi:hypothetical protein